MTKDLTTGSVRSCIIKFAIPLMIGNILTQVYNIVDSYVVGRFISSKALGAVGTSYSFTTFLYSVIIGLCMGSGVLMAMYFGRKDKVKLQQTLFLSFLFIGIITLVINVALFLIEDGIIEFMNVDSVIFSLTKDYLHIIYFGIIPIFLYHYCSTVSRSLGNSKAPVFYIGISTIVNIVLDLVFVAVLNWGIKGAAIATLIAQIIAAAGIMVHVYKEIEVTHLQRENCIFDARLFKSVLSYSFFTSLQQSIMNFGILMIQGLVNSFGVLVTSAFSAAVKIDTFAYVPVQDFGNAFATFISQNKGANEKERIHEGIRFCVMTSSFFSLFLSFIIYNLAPYLMQIFVSEKEIITIGVGYLRIEGAFYIGIGLLFLLYGLYRGIGQAWMSVVLTIISLGTRVGLAYLLAPKLGLQYIWWAIVIGWFLADFTGFTFWKIKKKKYL